MAGVKGRSGRKAHLKELDIDAILKRSEKVIMDALKAPDDVVSLDKKADIACKFVIKKMPDKVEMTQTGLAADEKAALLSAIKGFILDRTGQGHTPNTPELPA